MPIENQNYQNKTEISREVITKQKIIENSKYVHKIHSEKSEFQGRNTIIKNQNFEKIGKIHGFLNSFLPRY